MRRGVCAWEARPQAEARPRRTHREARPRRTRRIVVVPFFFFVGPQVERHLAGSTVDPRILRQEHRVAETATAAERLGRALPAAATARTKMKGPAKPPPGGDDAATARREMKGPSANKPPVGDDAAAGAAAAPRASSLEAHTGVPAAPVSVGELRLGLVVVVRFEVGS